MIYRSKKITPEQSSLLERPNFAQYPTEQELSTDKGTTNNETEKEVENDIRGIFPKDNAEWLNWISQGKADYLNKEKIQTLINQQRKNLAEVEYLDLDSVAKVIKDFENTSIEASDIAKQYELKTGEYANADNEMMYREGDPERHYQQLARDRYEERMQNKWYQSKEAFQDSMLSLKETMQAILGREVRMEDVAGFENAYLGENRLSSVNKAEADAFAHTLFKPMLDEVAKLAPTQAERQEFTEYMMALVFFFHYSVI